LIKYTTTHCNKSSSPVGLLEMSRLHLKLRLSLQHLLT